MQSHQPPFPPLHFIPLLPSELVIQSFNRNARGFPLFVYACACLVSAPSPLLHPLPGFLWLHLCPLDGLRPVPEPDSISLSLSLSGYISAHITSNQHWMPQAKALQQGKRGVGGVGSASVATFHSYGLAENSPAPAPSQINWKSLNSSTKAAAQQLRRFQLSRPLCVCLIIQASPSPTSCPSHKYTLLLFF